MLSSRQWCVSMMCSTVCTMTNKTNAISPQTTHTNFPKWAFDSVIKTHKLNTRFLMLSNFKLQINRVRNFKSINRFLENWFFSHLIFSFLPLVVVFCNLLLFMWFASFFGICYFFLLFLPFEQFVSFLNFFLFLQFVLCFFLCDLFLSFTYLVHVILLHSMNILPLFLQICFHVYNFWLDQCPFLQQKPISSDVDSCNNIENMRIFLDNFSKKSMRVFDVNGCVFFSLHVFVFDIIRKQCQNVDASMNYMCG